MTTEAECGDDSVLNRYPGSDLSISELCSALTKKLAQASDSRSPIPLPLVRSIENDLRATAIELRRIINRHDSPSHRLPYETLAMVASHLEDDTSLVTTTHVCHLWRTALVSSPRLWSHLTFANQKRALAFWERSKSVPLCVDLTGVLNPSEIVKESLRKVGTRVATWRGRHDFFLDEILGRSTPVLELLDVIEVPGLVWSMMQIRSLPSLRTLMISGSARIPFRAPHLTTFRATFDTTGRTLGGMSTAIVNFFKGCPLLEEVYVKYSEGERPYRDFTADGLVSIPYLRSLTHVSPNQGVQLGLFDRLSLPPTCQLVFATHATNLERFPRFPAFPTLRDPFNLSDITRAKIMARSHNLDPRRGTPHVVFSIELGSSRGARVSFEMESHHSGNYFDYSLYGLLNVFERVELGSAETLCLDHLGAPGSPVADFGPVHRSHITRTLQNYRNLKTLILVESGLILSFVDLDLFVTVDTLVVYSSRVRVRLGVEDPEVDVIYRVGDIAASRQSGGFPIKDLTLVFGDDEAVLLERLGDLGELKSYVGRVQVVSGVDALGWDVDKYFLGGRDHPRQRH